MHKTIEEYRVTHNLGSALMFSLWCVTLGAFSLWAYNVQKTNIAVSKADDLFRSTVDIGLESRVVTDTNSVIRLCSPTAANICGYTPNELVDKPFAAIIAQTSLAECKELLDIAIHDDPPGQVHRTWWDVRQKDGKTRKAEIIVRGVDSPIGRVAVITITPVESIEVVPPKPDERG